MWSRALLSPLTCRFLAPRPGPISRGLKMVVVPQAMAANTLLPEAASIEVHHYMSQVLDMWHFYSSLNLALREERFLGVQALTRELARQHCDHSQHWVAFLHSMGREVMLEQLLWEGEREDYGQRMTHEVKRDGVVGMLVPRLQEAVTREERIFRLLFSEKTMTVQDTRQESQLFGARVGALEYSIMHLRSGERGADLLISELLLPKA